MSCRAPARNPNALGAHADARSQSAARHTGLHARSGRCFLRIRVRDEPPKLGVCARKHALGQDLQCHAGVAVERHGSHPCTHPAACAAARAQEGLRQRREGARGGAALWLQLAVCERSPARGCDCGRVSGRNRGRQAGDGARRERHEYVVRVCREQRSPVKRRIRGIARKVQDGTTQNSRNFFTHKPTLRTRGAASARMEGRRLFRRACAHARAPVAMAPAPLGDLRTAPAGGQNANPANLQQVLNAEGTCRLQQL